MKEIVKNNESINTVCIQPIIFAAVKNILKTIKKTEKFSQNGK